MKIMKLSGIFTMALGAVLLNFPIKAISQVAPAAYQGTYPFAIGAGASNFDVDWGHNRMDGFTIWGQWRPRPNGVLAGLGIDAEARDIAYGRSNHIAPNFKQATFAGGPMFTIRKLHNFQPYGKFLFGLGSLDFHGKLPYYTHDTRTIYAPGGGIQIRAVHRLWVRADYEYQMWPNLFGNKTLDPQGFTLGFNYDFRPQWR